MRLSLRARATADASSAIEWYRGFGEASAERFANALEHAMTLIGESPSIGTPIRGGYRRFLVRGSPYAVVYRVEATRVLVVAVAHASRRPGYWERR